MAEQKDTKTQKKVEYVPFRDISIDQIKKLPTVLVKLEKQSNRNYGESVRLTVEFHPMFKKIIRSDKIIDVKKYNLILLQRKDLDVDEEVHVFKLPVRYFERHDIEGEVKYQRFEIMFTRNVVISDFFDFTDQELIETLELKLNFKEDKDSTSEFSIAQAEMDYVHFT